MLIAGGALAAAVSAGGWALWGRGRAASDDKSIAVLPFANLSGDPAQAYFADGVAEEVRGALARLGGLKVIGRASCEAVRNAPLTEAAKQLGVGNILTGSVRRSPTLIRVSAQLVDGRDGAERWSDTYDRAPGDALEIQSSIAEAVASALRIRLGEMQKASLTLGGTRNAEAHDLLLKAVALRRTGDSRAIYAQCLAMLDQALALDPDYAEAHARRSEFLSTFGNQYGATSDERAAFLAQAVTAARRAVKLAPRLAIGHDALGFAIKSRLDMGGAYAEYRRAYELASDDPEIVPDYAFTIGQLGRTNEAVSLAARVIELDPLDVGARASQAWILIHARRFADAEAVARYVLATAPNRINTRRTLAEILLLQGKLDEAQAEYSTFPADNPFGLTGEALVAARRNDRRGAEAILERLRPQMIDITNYGRGQIFAQLGDIDRAFATLDQAWAVRDPGLRELRVDPLLDPLRSDMRFKALETKLNFPA